MTSTLLCVLLSACGWISGVRVGYFYKEVVRDSIPRTRR